MDNFSVYIESTSSTCSEFTRDGHVTEEITIVISPLKITRDQNTLRVNSGCNMWRSCLNLKCQFSMASHEKHEKGKLIR